MLFSDRTLVWMDEHRKRLLLMWHVLPPTAGRERNDPCGSAAGGSEGMVNLDTTADGNLPTNSLPTVDRSSSYPVQARVRIYPLESFPQIARNRWSGGHAGDENQVWDAGVGLDSNGGKGRRGFGFAVRERSSAGACGPDAPATRSGVRGPLRRNHAAVAVWLIAVIVGGCGSSTLSKQDVEQEVSKQALASLKRHDGVRMESKCAKGDGNTYRCAVQAVVSSNTPGVAPIKTAPQNVTATVDGDTVVVDGL